MSVRIVTGDVREEVKKLSEKSVHCCNAILIELNPAYAHLAQNRIRDDAGMFGDVA